MVKSRNYEKGSPHITVYVILKRTIDKTLAYFALFNGPGELRQIEPRLLVWLCAHLSGALFFPLNSQTRFHPKPMLISYLGTEAEELIEQPQVFLVGTDSQPLDSLVSSRAVPHQLVVTILLQPPHRQARMQAHNFNVSAFTLTLSSHKIKIQNTLVLTATVTHIPC